MVLLKKLGALDLKLLMPFSLTKPFILHKKKSVGKCCPHCKNTFDFLLYSDPLHTHSAFILALLGHLISFSYTEKSLQHCPGGQGHIE